MNFFQTLLTDSWEFTDSVNGFLGIHDDDFHLSLTHHISELS